MAVTVHTNVDGTPGTVTFPDGDTVDIWMNSCLRVSKQPSMGMPTQLGAVHGSMWTHYEISYNSNQDPLI